jgi:hypothetical protein
MVANDLKGGCPCVFHYRSTIAILVWSGTRKQIETSLTLVGILADIRTGYL